VRTVSAVQAKASYKPTAPRRLKGKTGSPIQDESRPLSPYDFWCSLWSSHRLRSQCYRRNILLPTSFDPSIASAEMQIPFATCTTTSPSVSGSAYSPKLVAGWIPIHGHDLVRWPPIVFLPPCPSISADTALVASFQRLSSAPLSDTSCTTPGVRGAEIPSGFLFCTPSSTKEYGCMLEAASWSWGF